MDTDELYAASPVLAHVMQHPQAAVLLGGLTTREGHNELVFDGGAIERVSSAWDWVDHGQPRWAWIVELVDVPLLVCGVGLGSTPDAGGFAVESHWVAAQRAEDLLEWLANWCEDAPMRVAGALSGLR